ncbi:RagB/SusD family nutrient uptake outer membrane protein [Massilibacteroides vaginae]|uniref:RagB/SusD family nutrient uptake outer membrane protein n=1 Tax=Massilibacteroides vaginae TaxID=1673718 RepID=UPI000A1CAD20|nr:RagB/SusD family nutrient uptake outer membrane protein [Massilibacteroides vaginae]
MKKIYIGVSMFLLMVFSACSDFIEQDNKGNIGQPDYYSTAAGFKSLSNASYSMLRTLYGDDPWLYVCGTDLFANGRTSLPAGLGTYGPSLTEANTEVKDFYTNYYKAISLTNDVVYWGGKAEANAQLVAEARGLRAMYYLTLVQQFGGVPLVIERNATMINEVPRASAEDVFNFIISELTELSGSSALADRASGTNFGHFDKRAANHFLAKAYLTKGYESFGSATDFAAAKDAADKAIGGMKLTTPFATLFNMQNEENEEIIFSVQYNINTVENETKGNKQQAHFGAYLDGPEKGHKYTSSTLTPTLRMHEVFASSPKDERYDATFMQELRESYWDFYDDGKKNSSKVTYYYAPSWASDEASIAAWRAELPSRANAIVIPMIEKGPNIGGQTTTYNSKMREDVYGVASFRKFDDTDRKGTFATTASMHDIFLARVAETYLIAAEALIKGGKPGEALVYVNEVRGRAKATLATEKEMTVDYILDERARELAGEYHRWADLKRTGKLAEYAEKHNPDISTGAVGEKVLRPIPLAARELNPALTQNTGY